MFLAKYQRFQHYSNDFLVDSDDVHVTFVLLDLYPLVTTIFFATVLVSVTFALFLLA